MHAVSLFASPSYLLPPDTWETVVLMRTASTTKSGRKAFFVVGYGSTFQAVAE
jgi:hypothetical protein